MGTPSVSRAVRRGVGCIATGSQEMVVRAVKAIKQRRPPKLPVRHGCEVMATDEPYLLDEII